MLITEVWLATGQLVISVFRYVRRATGRQPTSYLQPSSSWLALLKIAEPLTVTGVFFVGYSSRISRRRRIATASPSSPPLDTNARPALLIANTMEVSSGNAAAPSDGTPGAEEPAVVKTNQLTKLGPGVPVSPPAQLTCAATPTCAGPSPAPPPPHPNLHRHPDRTATLTSAPPS